MCAIKTIIPDHLVDEIRDRYAEGGLSHRALAKAYDCSETTILRITRREGAYRDEGRRTINFNAPLPETTPEMAIAIKASQERAMRILAGEEPTEARPGDDKLSPEQLAKRKAYLGY